MTDIRDSALEPHLETRLNGQTAKIRWHELQRYFARGVVREVAPGEDLVAVGKAIIDNDTERVRQWLASQVLTVPDDARARRWHADDAELWALVVAPWVLVQRGQ